MTDKIIRIKLDAGNAKRDIADLDSGMGKLNTTVTRLVSAIAAAFSTQQIVAYADAFTNIQNKLRVVTSSTEELTRVTADLLQVANDSRASFDATADLFSKLTRSTEELGISQERIIAITSTINKSFAVAGATAEEASNAIRQLGQGLSAGALRGDEFNSVAEQAPGILRAVAAETGKTVGELREFAAEGGITAEMLIRSVENYSATVEEEYAKTNRTFEQSALVARNNATAFVGASEQVKAATTAAGNAIVLLSENLDVLVDGLILIASVVAGRYLTSIGASTAALIANTSAALASKVQYDALGVAITRTSAAATAGTVAVRGLSAAFAFLGGPAGVILLAASALAIYSSRAKEIEKTGLKEEIDKQIIKFRELNAEGQKLTFQKLANEQVALSEQLREATAEAERLRSASVSTATGNFSVGGNFSAYANQLRVVADINQQLNKITATQTALFNDRLPAIEKTTESLKGNTKALTDNFDAIRSVSSGIDALFSGDFNLFGDDKSDNKADQQTKARIAERISALKQETEISSSEYLIRLEVLNGFLTQQDAEIEISAQRRLESAIAQRDLLLSEEFITAEQRLEVVSLFEQQRLQIEQDTELARTELARDQMLQRMQMEQQTQDTYLETAQIGIGALANLIGGSTKAGKALKLIQAGVNAFQIYAASETAAALILATPPGPVLNPSLVPLAAAVSAKGKISAAAVLAAGAASTFGGVGSSSFSGGGGGFSSANQSLPTTPAAQQNVTTLEIAGISELVSELRNYDGLVPASLAARILDAIPSANRLRGEDV